MNTCFDAFKNINIEYKKGRLEISPCCISSTHSVQTIDFKQDRELDAIRQVWQTGEFPVECLKCKQSEDSDGTSRRTGSNQWYKDNGCDNTEVELTRLDYWTGDQCNLACVICGPHYSTTWKKELNFIIPHTKAVVNKFWKNLDLSILKFVHFNGGEPLMSKEHINFLEDIPNKQNVHINYNTNGTVLPTKKLLDLWAQFKLVQLDFSIDDIERRFEYQRYPAIWTETVENLQWFLKNAPHNCMFAVNTTVSVVNQYSLNKLDSWLANNFCVSRFTDPIAHRKQPCSGRLSTKNTNKKEIVEYLDRIDQSRGTSWRDVFPELVDYFKTDK